MTYAISIKMNFGNNCDDIHPEELEIKKKKMKLLVNPWFCTLRVHERKFTAILFDKRDAFLLYINHRP